VIEKNETMKIEMADDGIDDANFYKIPVHKKKNRGDSSRKVDE
jgi:hypothetical protein